MRDSLLTFSCAVLAAVLSGCHAPTNPWVYNAPPTTAEPAAPGSRPNHDRVVIVVGRFADPSKAPNYSSGVGRCMSDALARALLHDGKYDVWINPQLSFAVETVINLPSHERAEALGELNREHPDVHFVITGKVTDFYHSTDLPTEATRWGIFGRRSEAVAAIDMRIVDMHTRRVVGANHLKGTARAGSRPSGDIYGGVALDSYIFWNTPLGRASKSVIQSAVSRTERVVPGRLRDPHIAQLVSRRRVSINGGTAAGLVDGRDYYLVHQGNDDDEPEYIMDSATDMPLLVRIDSISRSSATGWLRGEAPIEQELRGARLRSLRSEQQSLARDGLQTIDADKPDQRHSRAYE